MKDDIDRSECAAARSYYDARLAEDTQDTALTPDIKTQMEKHLAACQDCIAWQRQVTDMIAEASHIPQFDVPEALTQRILTAVSKESSRRESVSGTVVLFAVATVAFLILSMGESFESTDGIASWAVGLLAMFAIAWLVTGSQMTQSAHEGN